MTQNPIIGWEEQGKRPWRSGMGFLRSWSSCFRITHLREREREKARKEDFNFIIATSFWEAELGKLSLGSTCLGVFHKGSNPAQMPSTKSCPYHWKSAKTGTNFKKSKKNRLGRDPRRLSSPTPLLKAGIQLKGDQTDSGLIFSWTLAHRPLDGYHRLG